ncbi:MAG TPA: calcium/sodium antiporter [Burkholderiales bacterium]
MLVDFAALALGIVCAGFGGELFIRGTIGLAHWARVSPAIVGTTLAAFATSSPELAVAISAALAKTPQISLGDALGSNVVNFALVLGLALLISGTRSPRHAIRRDFPVALLVPLLLGGLLLDGSLSRFDGVLLLGFFAGWLVAVTLEARRQRQQTSGQNSPAGGLGALVRCAVALALLAAAGNLGVMGAAGLATAFGVSKFVAGATIVALGTSVPELATTVIAKLRGHDDIALGTLLGSNIFNCLFIVGVAAVIYPIVVPLRELAVALTFGIVAVAATYPAADGMIRRWRGALLLALYCSYVALIIEQGVG